jgi:hypothetical protein
MGAKNKRTVAVEQAMQVVAAKLQEAVTNVFEGDGVAYMQSVYKDPSFPAELRLDAAAKAARFERPALQATLTRDVTPLPSTPSAIDAAIVELVRKACGCAPTIDAERIADGAGEPAPGGPDAAAAAVAGS